MFDISDKLLSERSEKHTHTHSDSERFEELVTGIILMIISANNHTEGGHNSMNTCTLVMQPHITTLQEEVSEQSRAVEEPGYIQQRNYSINSAAVIDSFHCVLIGYRRAATMTV